MKNKGIIGAIVIAALLLLSFKKKKRGSIIVSEAEPLKSSDADFLILAPDNTKYYASDGTTVMGLTRGNVYADGFYSRQYPEFYILREFGSTKRYFVYAYEVTRL